MKLRILHIIDTLELGGAERLLTDVVKNLPEFTHYVIYMSGKGTLAEELSAYATIIPIYFKSKLDIFSCVRKIRRRIKENQIDIVHSHLVMSTLLARMACPENVPLFSTLHSMVGTRFFGKGKGIQRIVERSFYEKRHCIIAVSRPVLEDYDQAIGVKGRAIVLPNFVDDPYFENHQPSRTEITRPLRLIAVGSMKKEKNYSYLLTCIKQVAADVELDIYGAGPLEEELKNVVEKGRLPVKFKGVHKHLYRVFHEYDLFVMSSLVEGHPLALLEAMAAGLPVLVSDITGFRDVLKQDGIYFSLKDPETFANQIHRVLKGETDLHQMAMKNMKYTREKFGKTSYLATLKGLYESAKDFN